MNMEMYLQYLEQRCEYECVELMQEAIMDEEEDLPLFFGADVQE